MFPFRKKKSQSCKVVAFILKSARNSKRSHAYKRSYRNIARHLSNFEKSRNIEIVSDIFNDAMMEDFIYYLKDLNLMKSTISTITDKTKYILRRMKQDSCDVDMSVFNISVVEEQADSVYITSDEIEKLHKMTVRGKEQQIVKDLFLVGCLTGMRFSDYSQLTQKNIVGNYIYRKTIKTGETVIVPMHRIVKEIIAKYNGNFPQYSNSLQNFNATIKRICKRAGFNEKVFTERTRGHKTENAFFTYIRINKRENARELSKHPFFN